MPPEFVIWIILSALTVFWGILAICAVFLSSDNSPTITKFEWEDFKEAMRSVDKVDVN